MLLPSRRRSAVAATAAVLVALSGAPAIAQVVTPLPTAVPAVQAAPADAFVGSVGVATHLSRNNEYANKAMVNQRILESGIRRVRGSWGPGDTATRDQAVALGRAGVKIMFWTGQVGSNLESVKRAVKDANAIVPGMIDSIEGPNEQDGHTGLRSFVQQYSQMFRSDPETAALRIYGPSMANVGSSAPYQQLGDIRAWVDAANVHNYPGGRMMSDEYIDSIYSFAGHNVGSGGKVIASEVGYSTATSAPHQPHPAVPEQAAATLVPRVYLEHFRRGISETYLYELVDEAGDPHPWERGFGLLRSDFTPKPAFTALSNLVTLLKDPGPPVVAGRLGMALSGTNAATRTLLLQKRDGSFHLVLWQQAEVWDRWTKQWTNPSPVPVRLTLGSAAEITTYSPITGTSATSRSTGTTIDLASSAAPTVIRISPSTAATPTVTPSVTATPVPGPLPATTHVTSDGPWSKRINAGGPAVLDASGKPWEADQSFTGGSTYAVSSDITSPVPAVSSTSRFGQVTYDVPVPSAGDYLVRLYLTETFWEAPLKRQFNVTAESDRIATNLDLYASVGKNRTHVLQFPVTVSDGSLTVGLQSLINYATVDGLEITKLAGAPVGTTPATPTAAPTTAAPTTVPTAAPTTAPTPAPTTAAPTTAPTASPTPVAPAPRPGNRKKSITSLWRR
jgi:hypothetical protein